MSLRSDLIPEPIFLDLPDEAGRIVLSSLFPPDKSQNPVELEIGSGKGTFLLAITQAKPDTNFIGIEWAKEYARYAADRLRRHQCFNTRITSTEASWFIRCHVPDGSLSHIHIYFPDPWPKARHHKRRLIQVPFLQEVHRILLPGGTLRLVTDHADYFAHMEATLAAQSLLTVIPFASPVPGVAQAGMLVGTNFEKKYLTQGRPFHATAAQKLL